MLKLKNNFDFQKFTNISDPNVKICILSNINPGSLENKLNRCLNFIKFMLIFNELDEAIGAGNANPRVSTDSGVITYLSFLFF